MERYAVTSHRAMGKTTALRSIVQMAKDTAERQGNGLQVEERRHFHVGVAVDSRQRFDMLMREFAAIHYPGCVSRRRGSHVEILQPGHRTVFWCVLKPADALGLEFGAWLVWGSPDANLIQLVRARTRDQSTASDLCLAT